MDKSAAEFLRDEWQCDDLYPEIRGIERLEQVLGFAFERLPEIGSAEIPLIGCRDERDFAIVGDHDVSNQRMGDGEVTDTCDLFF